jgi:HEAT repeat protein
MAAEALGKLCDYRATMPLIACLKDQHDIVRVNALRALARIGNPVAKPYLAEALESDSAETKLAAIEGLVMIHAADAIPRLRRMARRWPAGREPGEVRETARWAVEILEAETAGLAEESEEEPEEGSESTPGPG